MLWVTALIGLASVGTAIVQAPDQQVEVAAVRFYRPDVGTVVLGLCRVPFGLLEPVRGGVNPFGAYRVSLVVRDAGGLALTEESWSQNVPATIMGVTGASAMEHFSFAAGAGEYTVEVAVTDSASGRVGRSHARIAAFDADPVVSDLLLSASIRQADSGVVPASGEISRGGFFITAQMVPVLTPVQTRLFYYLELYPGHETSAELVARVRDRNGRQVIATAGETFPVSAAGVAASGVNLAGLPPGDYALELEVEFGDTTLVRTAPFRMAGFETETAIAAAVEDRAADVFAHLTEDQLDTLYAPLVHMMERGERGIFEELSVDGKRNYLRQFWSRRDPTPGTAANERQDQFYQMIAFANRQFRERGAGDVPGWRTDRGRIYIRYGEPDEVLHRPEAGATPPYEVWKYTRGRLRKFVFLDETRLGNYILVFTDERREPSLPNWEDILGLEAVEDIRRF